MNFTDGGSGQDVFVARWCDNLPYFYWMGCVVKIHSSLSSGVLQVDICSSAAYWRVLLITIWGTSDFPAVPGKSTPSPFPFSAPGQ